MGHSSWKAGRSATRSRIVFVLGHVLDLVVVPVRSGLLL